MDLLTQLTHWLPLQKLSQKINDKVNLQEANLLENGCYHCNMFLKKKKFMDTKKDIGRKIT